MRRISSVVAFLARSGCIAASLLLILGCQSPRPTGVPGAADRPGAASEVPEPFYRAELSEYGIAKVLGGSCEITRTRAQALTRRSPFLYGEKRSLVVAPGIAESQGAVLRFDPGATPNRWVSTSSDGKFIHMNGALDFHLMYSPDINAITDDGKTDLLPNKFIPFDFGGSAFRLILSHDDVPNGLVLRIRTINEGPNVFYDELQGESTWSVKVGEGRDPVLRPGERYHVAVTFRTDAQSNVTMSLWITPDVHSINVGEASLAYASKTFKIHAVPGMDLSEPLFYLRGPLVFGQANGNAEGVGSFLFQQLSLWDGTVWRPGRASKIPGLYPLGERQQITAMHVDGVGYHGIYQLNNSDNHFNSGAGHEVLPVDDGKARHVWVEVALQHTPNSPHVLFRVVDRSGEPVPGALRFSGDPIPRPQLEQGTYEPHNWSEHPDSFRNQFYFRVPAGCRLMAYKTIKHGQHAFGDGSYLRVLAEMPASDR